MPTPIEQARIEAAERLARQRELEAALAAAPESERKAVALRLAASWPAQTQAEFATLCRDADEDDLYHWTAGGARRDVSYESLSLAERRASAAANELARRRQLATARDAQALAQAERDAKAKAQGDAALEKLRAELSAASRGALRGSALEDAVNEELTARARERLALDLAERRQRYGRM
jgi:hypothetical protein